MGTPYNNQMQNEESNAKNMIITSSGLSDEEFLARLRSIDNFPNYFKSFDAFCKFVLDRAPSGSNQRKRFKKYLARFVQFEQEPGKQRVSISKIYDSPLPEQKRGRPRKTQ